MRVNVKNYLYRHFDNMLILQTEDDTILYIYCPSECIYEDWRSRFYCYTENILRREAMSIDYVDYHTEPNSDIACNGVAHFIHYGDGRNAWHDNRGLSYQHLAEAGGYWHYRNDSSVVEADRKKRQWADFAATMSDVIK